MSDKKYNYTVPYVFKDPLPEPCYVYIREVKSGQVKFSVLGVLSDDPDFSECGIFTVAEEVFHRAFLPIEAVVDL